MGPSELIGLSVLMMRLGRSTRGKSGPLQSPDVTREDVRTPSGTVFDIYRHRRKKRGIWVLVPGLTVNGGKDPRLINFAYTLARGGVTCVVPTLAGLAACRWETGDLEALVEVIAAASGDNGETVGLMGFSFGAGYCLVAAGREEISRRVRRVIGFGGYHSMARLFEGYGEMSDREPNSEIEWDDIIYRRLALLYGYGEASSFPPGVWEEMGSLLRRYCADAPLEEKRGFYDRYLRGVDISGVIREAVKPGVFRALSPAGNMGGLRCPVTLIHDRDDGVVPLAHAEGLFSELRGLPRPGRHRLVVSSLLSHVSPARIPNIPDVIRFARAMAPVLRKIE